MKKYLCVICNFYAPCSSPGFIEYIDMIYKNGGCIDIYIDTTVIREPSLSECARLSRIFYNSEILYLRYIDCFSFFKKLIKQKINNDHKYTDFLTDGSYSPYQKSLLSVYQANSKNSTTFCCTTPFLFHEIK
jgi:hypothetical protein